MLRVCGVDVQNVCVGMGGCFQEIRFQRKPLCCGMLAEAQPEMQPNPHVPDANCPASNPIAEDLPHLADDHPGDEGAEST